MDPLGSQGKRSNQDAEAACLQDPPARNLYKSDEHRGLNTGDGVPLKGSFEGIYKGSIVGFCNIGALVIGMVFWGLVH